VLVALGCGRDYTPPVLETTGREPPGLGQVLDVHLSFPDLRPLSRTFAGVTFDMRLEIEGQGHGTWPARASYSDEVEDLSDGTTLVLFTPDTWSAGTLGPLRIDNTLFELVLTGDSDDGGWSVRGRAYETLTATEGTFVASRRQRFLVAGTDFFSEFGSLSLVEIVRGEEIVVHDELELISSDAVLRVTSGAVFAINRMTFDNVQRLDPERGFRTAWQRGVGAGSNPQDIVVLSPTAAYLTRYEPPFDDLLELDPRTGAKEGAVDLEALAENPDGTPRAARAVLAEGAVFVGLQDIDRSFTVFGEGKLAVVDPERDEVVGAIPLGGQNPAEMEILHGADGRTRIYVALAGIFAGLEAQELSGGVVVVDAFERVLSRVALDDDDAGGNVGGLALASDLLGYVVVADEQFVNRVLAFDPAAARVLRTIWTGSDYVPEIEVGGGGVLAIPDRDVFDPRLCLYRVPPAAGGVEAEIGCARLALPPFSIEALD
jgi:hypothetical protein